MRILFFGSLGDCFGREAEIKIPGNGCSIAELRKKLRTMKPDCEDAISAPSVRACVDEAMVSDDFVVKPGQEIAFFPPLSGG